jgi:hypothetical protein
MINTNNPILCTYIYYIEQPTGETMTTVEASGKPPEITTISIEMPIKTKNGTEED